MNTNLKSFTFAALSLAMCLPLVPAAALTESGLKRHYKEPEPLKTLRLLAADAQAARAEFAA